ncbi:40S ribosomal protein S7 [Entamoeba marina]
MSLKGKVTAEKYAKRVKITTPVEDKKPGFDAYSRLVKEAVQNVSKEIPELKNVKVINAKKIPIAQNKKATIIFIPIRMMRYVRLAFGSIIEKLEKSLGGQVFFIGKRIVAPTVKSGQKGAKIFKPISRTRKSVHECYMQEMLYPVQVVGQRTRVSMLNKKPTQSRTIFVGVDDQKTKNSVKARLQDFTTVYKNITGEQVKFTFPVVA